MIQYSRPGVNAPGVGEEHGGMGLPADAPLISISDHLYQVPDKVLTGNAARVYNAGVI
jgi:hypothetical protein